MSELKDLVPPLELCKKIPAGEFAESALAWIDHRDVYPEDNADPSVVVRKISWAATSKKGVFPAPTLQEIMEALPHDDAYNDLLIGYSEKVEKLTGWHIYYNGDRKRHCFDKNAATAAIKLWFKLKGIEYEE